MTNSRASQDNGRSIVVDHEPPEVPPLGIGFESKGPSHVEGMGRRLSPSV